MYKTMLEQEIENLDFPYKQRIMSIFLLLLIICVIITGAYAINIHYESLKKDKEILALTKKIEGEIPKLRQEIGILKSDLVALTEKLEKMSAELHEFKKLQQTSEFIIAPINNP
jgi:hypothetical protein